MSLPASPGFPPGVQLPFTYKSPAPLKVTSSAAGACPHDWLCPAGCMFPSSAGWAWGGRLVLGNSLEHFAAKLLSKFCVVS